MFPIVAAVLAGILGIIALILVFQDFTSAQKTTTATNVLTQVSTVVSAIISQYTGNPNFTNFPGTNPPVPSEWVGTGGTYTIPGGGTATLAPSSVGTGTDNGFTLTLSNISKTVCGQFGSVELPQMASMAINGTTASNPDYNGGTATNWPPALSSDCTTGANTVILTMSGN